MVGFSSRRMPSSPDPATTRPSLCSAVLAVVWIASCGGGSGVGSDGGTGGAGAVGDAGTDRGSDGPTCGAVAACGGAVVGRWNVTDGCVTAAPDLSNVCVGITATVKFLFTGSASYNADLTYTQTGSNGGTVHYQFPSACIGTQTCAQVQAVLLSAGSAAGMGFTFQSAVCASGGGGCACDATLASQAANETGTYSTTGGTLTTVHGATSDSAQYCVNGVTMHQMPNVTTGATGSIVLTKQ